MVFLFLSILFVVMVVFIVLRVKYGEKWTDTTNGVFTAFAIGSGFLIALCIFWIIVNAPKIASESIYQQKIEMYEEENTRIEKDIDRIVNEYMEHEQNTFNDVKADDSSISLVTLFPELKSDQLVQQQLEIHAANNDKIKNLKEEKLDLGTIKWILYFGK